MAAKDWTLGRVFGECQDPLTPTCSPETLNWTVAKAVQPQGPWMDRFRTLSVRPGISKYSGEGRTEELAPRRPRGCECDLGWQAPRRG